MVELDEAGQQQAQTQRPLCGVRSAHGFTGWLLCLWSVAVGEEGEEGEGGELHRSHWPPSRNAQRG